MTFPFFISFKRLLPKSLYGRAFLIIFTPLVLVQIITTYVFLDRHLDSVTKLLAGSIASEIAVATQIYGDSIKETTDGMKTLSSSNENILANLKLAIRYVPQKQLLKEKSKISYKHPWADEILENALREKLNVPFIFLTDKENIFVDVEISKGLLEISLPHKRLLSKTTPLVFLGTFGASALFLTISLLFMRNQVRPIQKLAEAAEKFGKGQDVTGFRPQGALEVRKAAHAFLLMKDRIQKQIAQRTDMLAGISHDLRTPLTRMKLQLALLPESEDIHYLQQDIFDMEMMIQEYLEFVRGEGEEKPVLTDMMELIRTCVDDLKRKSNTIEFKEDTSLKNSFLLNIRPQAMKRCLNNLLNNASRYAPMTWIQIEVTSAFLLVHVDDNGPGILEKDREDVFRPFFRLESSRNMHTGGVGLGLSIARDIAKAHGGDILLSTSSFNGLRATLKLPL